MTIIADTRTRAETLFGLLDKGTLRRWDRASRTAETLEPSELKQLRQRARSLARRIDKVLHVAEERLALPLPGEAGVRRPMHSDWASTFQSAANSPWGSVFDICALNSTSTTTSVRSTSRAPPSY